MLFEVVFQITLFYKYLDVTENGSSSEHVYESREILRVKKLLDTNPYVDDTYVKKKTRIREIFFQPVRFHRFSLFWRV